MEVDRRIVCIDKKNEGLPLARKTGILKANGKYIQHLDSDDTLIDGAIENPQFLPVSVISSSLDAVRASS